MHGTALALARSSGLAENFRHHAVHVDTLGDAMAVSAVGRSDAVAIAKSKAHASRRRLLAGVKVNCTWNVTSRHFLIHPFLEGPDGLHGAVGIDQFFARQLHRPLPFSET